MTFCAWQRARAGCEEGASTPPGLMIVRAHQHGDRGDHVRAALALDEPLHLGVVLGRTAEGVGAEDAHARHLLLEPLRPSVECAAAEVED